MFDIEKVGKNIAELRKKNNMTQFELADKLDISFQAVSNWERGKSMPDISKLPLLSEMFNVPIEMLLGEYSELIEKAAKGDIKESFERGTITLEEVYKAAYVLKPSQLDIIAKSKSIKDLSNIENLLPFFSNDVLNSLAIKAMQEKKYHDLNIVAPFASQNVIDEIASEMINNGENIVGIAPFISKDVMYELAEKIYQKSDIALLVDIAPFLPEEQLLLFFQKEHKKTGRYSWELIAPVLKRQNLDELVQKLL